MEVESYSYFKMDDLDLGLNNDMDMGVRNEGLNSTPPEFSSIVDSYMAQILFDEKYQVQDENDMSLFTEVNGYNYMAMPILSPISQVHDVDILDNFNWEIEASTIFELEDVNDVNGSNSVENDIKHFHTHNNESSVSVTTTEISKNLLVEERSMDFENSGNIGKLEIPSPDPISFRTCEICGRTLCRRANLRRHIRNVHLDLNPNKKRNLDDDISIEKILESPQVVLLFGNDFLKKQANSGELNHLTQNNRKRKRDYYARRRGMYKCGACQQTLCNRQSFTRHVVRVHLKRPRPIGLDRKRDKNNSGLYTPTPTPYNVPELTASLTDNVTGLIRHIVVKFRTDGSIFLQFDPSKDSKIVEEDLKNITAINVHTGGNPPTNPEMDCHTGETTSAGRKSDADADKDLERHTGNILRSGDKYSAEQKSHTEEKSDEKFHTGENSHTGEKSQTMRNVSTRHNSHTKKQKYTGHKGLKCELCESKFSYFYNLRRHMESVHILPAKLVNMGCPTCGQYFETLQLLKTHVKSSHPQRNSYGCSEPNCQETFSDVGKYRRHLIKHKMDSDRTCDYEECGKKFNFVRELKVHMIKVHGTPSKPYQPTVKKMYPSALDKKPENLCEFCGKIFTLPVYLELHIFQNHGELNQ